MSVLRLLAARVFTGHELFAPGFLDVDAAGRVTAVGATTNPPRAPGFDAEGQPSGSKRHVSAGTWGPTGVEVVDLGEVTLVPGLVDVHAHGGGGASFSDDPATVLAAHAASGTTTMVASLVTQGLDVLEGQVRMLASLVEAGELGGIHLEGPWLAESYKGAHPAELLRDPMVRDVERLLDAGGGAVVMVTLAVERRDALASVALLSERGVVAALGHSDCDYDQARAAIDAGVTGATHLFNAMPPLKHRAPGPILALLDDERVWCELIADGVHSHLDLVRWVAEKIPERVVFVTDAMAAAGSADGNYVLGDLPVEVRAGIARIAGTDTIAGSTLLLSTAVRNAVTAGLDWQIAVRAATLNPARFVGLREVGEFVEGSWADAVAFSPDWGVERVYRRGAAI